MYALKSKASEEWPKKSTIAERAMFVERIRELDRDFAKQTKQLTAYTKRLMRKRFLNH